MGNAADLEPRGNTWQHKPRPSPTPTLVDAPSTAIAQDRWTRRAAFVVGICFLVYIFDIYELTTFQVALPAIIVEFNITRLDAGALTR